MSEPNYESKWWGYIYDQMMAGQQDVVDANLRFYHANLRDVSGPVLECACGTGLLLLPLLALGLDMHGFDISRSMLATLMQKAAQQRIDDAALDFCWCTVFPRGARKNRTHMIESTMLPQAEETSNAGHRSFPSIRFEHKQSTTGG